jgi:hypothetical protein
MAFLYDSAVLCKLLMSAVGRFLPDEIERYLSGLDPKETLSLVPGPIKAYP